MATLMVTDSFPSTGRIQAVAQAQADCQQFDQMGHSICGRFLQYWVEHGGLVQQGYPISGPFNETSATDGKVYVVQYFERAVFELHPENAAPYDVLLSLLGSIRYREKYPAGAPKQVPNTLPYSLLLPQTGKRLGGAFLAHWQSHGGLEQQGYPISDEFTESSETDGKTYTVQYFERAVFESHPENSPPNDVLLSQLGTFRLEDKYGAGSTVPSPSGFASGGLGLPRAAWERIHGAGVEAGDPMGLGGGRPCSYCAYEGAPYGGTYIIWFSPDSIVVLSNYLEQSVPISTARAESRKLLPSDAQLISQDETVRYGGGGASIYDTYFSQSLSAVYPPHTYSPSGNPDLWSGSRPGTFTVELYMLPHGPDGQDLVVRIQIYTGRHN